MTVLSNKLNLGVAVHDTPKKKTQKPNLYMVVVLNDDISTAQFVCDVFENFFNKSPNDAFDFMMEVHNNGSAIGGLYSKDVAQTKIRQIKQFGVDYPLKVIMIEEQSE